MLPDAMYCNPLSVAQRGAPLSRGAARKGVRVGVGDMAVIAVQHGGKAARNLRIGTFC